MSRTRKSFHSNQFLAIGKAGRPQARRNARDIARRKGQNGFANAFAPIIQRQVFLVNCDIGGSGDIYTGDSDSGESGVGAGGSDISVSDIDDGSGGT